MIRLAPLVVVVAGCGRFGFFEMADAPTDAGCAHTFCDPFERTTQLGPWDTMRENNGTLAIDNGVLVANETSIMPATAQVSLTKSFGIPATTSVHVELDMEFTAGSDGEIDLVQIKWADLPDPCTSFGVFLVRDRQTNSVALQETYAGCGGQGNITTPIAAFPATAPSGMHHVAIDITLGTTATARVAVVVDATPFSKALTSYDLPASRITLNAGIANAQVNATTWTVRYDNVIVDLH